MRTVQHAMHTFFAQLVSCVTELSHGAVRADVEMWCCHGSALAVLQCGTECSVWYGMYAARMCCLMENASAA